MDLEFDSDQSELRRSVQAMLSKECPIALVRGVVEGDASWSGLWKQMVELGWPALVVPERYGGLGLGYADLAVVLEELGRQVAPGPFLPTVTQFVPAVLEAASEEQAARYLGAVASGNATGTLAVVDDGSWRVDDVSATAREEGGGWIVEGVKRHVIEAGNVDEIVVAARIPGTHGEEGICLVVVPQTQVRATPVNALDQSRQLDTVELDGVRVGPDRVLGQPGAQGRALRRALEVATLAISLETVGTCQSIFDIALDHAKSRHQFGVPIASFQAMKHKFADMLVALERARALAYLATAAMTEERDDRALHVAVAKAAAADAQRHLAQEGIQALGGIGYTWEHDMHLYVKRAKTGGALFGGAREHHETVARLLGIGSSRRAAGVDLPATEAQASGA